MISAILAAMILAAGSETAAQAPVPATPPTPAVASAAEAPAKDKVVCRNETTLGSRLPKKVCRSAQADAEARQRNREGLEQLQRGARGPAGN